MVLLIVFSSFFLSLCVFISLLVIIFWSCATPFYFTKKSEYALAITVLKQQDKTAYSNLKLVSLRITFRYWCMASCRGSPISKPFIARSIIGWSSSFHGLLPKLWWASQYPLISPGTPIASGPKGKKDKTWLVVYTFRRSDTRRKKEGCCIAL